VAKRVTHPRQIFALGSESAHREPRSHREGSNNEARRGEARTPTHSVDLEQQNSGEDPAPISPTHNSENTRTELPHQAGRPSLVDPELPNSGPRNSGQISTGSPEWRQRGMGVGSGPRHGARFGEGHAPSSPDPGGGGGGSRGHHCSLPRAAGEEGTHHISLDDSRRLILVGGTFALLTLGYSIIRFHRCVTL